MSQRRAGIFDRCERCKLNNDLCVCSEIHPFSINTNISLVVHVRELKLTSNTAQFVEILMPDQAQIHIRGKVFENFTPDAILNRPGTPIFLYPHEDAEELNEDYMKRHPGPYHLIVPDGNWHQARKVRQREAGFKSIPAVKLPPGIMGEYQLRRAPHAEWVSTYEAVAHALGIIEGKEVTEKMMVFFRHWVKTTMFNRAKFMGED